jgi:4-hydroxybenzoate polyprenyltransferase
MSTAGAIDGEFAGLGFSAEQWIVAAGIGVYIVGVTWFARSEALTSRRGPLVLGATIMVAGIGLLAVFPRFRPAATPLNFSSELVWPGLLMLLMISVFRRCVLAIVKPEPEQVQRAVKQGILSLIVLDAAVCLAVRGPMWSLAILALLLPTLWLGRWVYST